NGRARRMSPLRQGYGGLAPKSPEHYSYAVYADPAMAERFDAMRFSGPIGRLIADTQEQQIAAFLAPLEGRRVLDVGTGTGRAAIALARRGAIVTGVDASAEMLQVAARRAASCAVSPPIASFSITRRSTAPPRSRRSHGASATW